MNQIFVLSTLLSVLALSFSSLVGSNRYGAHHSGNSLNYQGGNRYSGGHHTHLQSRAPAHQSYGAPRGHGYGARQPSAPRQPSLPRQPAAPYGASRHLSAPSAPSAPHYGGPVNYGGPVPYGPQSHASGPSHYSSSAKRSVYQQSQSQQHGSPSYGGPSIPSYAQPQTYSQTHQTAKSTSQTHGREMKYTIRDPQNRGTTHVSETHVVSNKQMHGAEAEAAMKKLMGSMGPGSDGGFQDLVKGMGLPFY